MFFYKTSALKETGWKVNGNSLHYPLQVFCESKNRSDMEGLFKNTTGAGQRVAYVSGMLQRELDSSGN